MKQIHFLIIVLLVNTISFTKALGATNNKSLETYADSLFQTSVERAEIAGGAILVFQNGEMLLKKSYGYASLELSAQMPEDAVFEIGSVTKQFTAAAILQLAEDGKLSLEDDFTKYLNFNSKGRKITIRNLLNHTSGLKNYTEMPEYKNLSFLQYNKDTIIRLVEKYDLMFEPGEAMHYTNSGYFFLGLIIEKLTGQTYEEYLTKTFFEPLGMSQTFYSSNAKIIKNKVYGYDFTKNGLIQTPYLNQTWPYSAGSLCSTTSDLLTWMRAIYEGKTLNKNLCKTIVIPAQLNDGTKLRYAKGLYNYSTGGEKLIGHGGGINGFFSDTRYFPEDGLYIVCLVNTGGPKDAAFFANKITWKILEKQNIKTVPVDNNHKSVSGKYKGMVQGNTVTLIVNALPNSITISPEGYNHVDTLKTYIGDNTWLSNENMFIFKNDECHVDIITGHYILKKYYD